MENTSNNPIQDNGQPIPKKHKLRWLWIAAIILALAVVIGLGAYVLFQRSTKQASSQDCKNLIAKLPTAEIKISSAGFEPATINIKRCQQVNWTNTDGKPHEVAADPYPTSSTYPEFAGPALTQNDSFSFVFEKSGDFTYHDQLNPLKFKGTVIVK